MKKRLLTMAMAAVMTLSMSITSFAAAWETEGERWRFKMDDGTYAVNGWQWLDGNKDGVAECYYFDANGYMLANTVTPDGYQVNADGAWVMNGVVQTQNSTSQGIRTTTVNGVTHNEGYDSEHPLAGMLDTWNLRVTDETSNLNFHYVVNENIHAMLTNQMEYYIDWYDMAWAKGYEEENKAEEYAIYEWLCNWLNGMDFENMTEMERAKEIQKVLGTISYRVIPDAQREGKSSTYWTLINKEGQCFDYAVLAKNLSKALGLKCALTGTADHALYFIQVDGQTYYGSNGLFILDVPYSDFAQDDRTRFYITYLDD